MNLQYLKSFYTTVKLNSISKAAIKLHLTQPGLSMQIQALEKELGSSLLIRSNKGVKLTDAGQIVFDYADTIISLQDNIEKDLENLLECNKVLSISSCRSIGEYALPCSIYLYKKNNEDVDINFDVNNSTKVIESLENRNSNIGIIQDINKKDNLDYHKIVSDKILLVGSSSVNFDSISVEQLKDIPLITRENGSGLQAKVNKYLSKHKINEKDLDILYSLNSVEGIKSSVISGKGFAFLPHLTIRRALKDNLLKVIELEGIEMSSDYYIAYRKGYTLSSHEADFMKFIKSNKRGFC